MGSGLDVKIFLLLQAAGVGQGVATPLVGAFYHHFLQSLSDRFLVRQRIPFGIDFYVRQRVERMHQLVLFQDFSREGNNRLSVPKNVAAPYLGRLVPYFHSIPPNFDPS